MWNNFLECQILLGTENFKYAHLEPDMLFFKINKQNEIVTGAEYQRCREYNLVERAIVQWVGDDTTGIPHVRYSCKIDGMRDGSDTRFLAKSEFARQFAFVA